MKRIPLCTLLLIFSALLSACGGNAGKAPADTFIYGTTAYGVSMQNAGLHPHRSYMGWSTVRYGVGETLYRLEDDLSLSPWLAASDRILDTHTLEITLRDDVTFSNGKPVTAEAVKACLEALVSDHDRAKGDLRLTSIEADGQVLRLRTEGSGEELRHYLTEPYAAVIDVDAGEVDRTVIGTGPYIAVAVSDTEVKLRKNDAYWGDLKPTVENVIIRSVPDGNTLTLALQAGDIDAAQGLPYASHSLFSDVKAYKKSTATTSRLYQIACNFHRPVLQDVRIRKAISLAIDRKAFVDVLLRGNGTVAASPFPDFTPYSEGLLAPPLDPARAQALLAEAGCADTDGDGYVERDGMPLTLRFLTYTSRQELPLLAEAVQSDLKKIGTRVDIVTTDNWRAKVAEDDFDLFAKAIVTLPTGSPFPYFRSHFARDGIDNAGHYDSPQFDAILQRAGLASDATALTGVTGELTDILLQDCALIPVAHLSMTLIMQSNIEGLSAHPSDFYEITSALRK